MCAGSPNRRRRQVLEELVVLEHGGINVDCQAVNVSERWLKALPCHAAFLITLVDSVPHKLSKHVTVVSYAAGASIRNVADLSHPDQPVQRYA